MKARFLHFADCHLGYKQYNSTERFDDFARAFLVIVDAAIEQKVDFVVLAGDLFQKRAIDALTLNQAMVGLERLKKADIPCIAVEGNHEMAYYADAVGWLEFLAARRLLILLDADFEEGVALLTAHTGGTGAYIDPVPGLRIFGLRYRGAGTGMAIASYADAIAAMPQNDVEYTLFIAHTGVEGVLAGQSGGLTHRQLAVLRPHVDYLALGHVHKPFEFDQWIYNPGSPETCSMTEAAWKERGYYLVDVDTEAARIKPTETNKSTGTKSTETKSTMVDSIEAESIEIETPETMVADAKAEEEGQEEESVSKHTATLQSNVRRPFHRFGIKVDLHESPQALEAYCREFLKRRARDLASKRRDATNAPVVELQLTGVLAFDRTALDIGELTKMLEEFFQPLYAQVRNLSRAAAFAIESGDRVSRPELERQVISELFARDARFRKANDEWVNVALNLKNLALSGGSPEAILKELSANVPSLEPAEQQPDSVEK